jgi:hypothetical protein
MAARGHKLEDLIPLIHEATTAIDKKLFSSYLTNAIPLKQSKKGPKVTILPLEVSPARNHKLHHMIPL